MLRGRAKIDFARRFFLSVATNVCFKGGDFFLSVATNVCFTGEVSFASEVLQILPTDAL